MMLMTFELNLKSLQNILSMAEKIEIEQLTKSLTHIISTLNDLISKNNTPTLIQADTTRLKKTADMTYHEYLVKVLANRRPVEISGNKPSYRLQEDLELLLELSSYVTISNKSFEDIAEKGRLNRSVESLKSRYNDYLSKVGEGEMKKIVAWVEREGVEGYLFFEDKELRLSLTDPREEKKEKKEDTKKRGRGVSLEVTEKKFEKKGAVKKPLPTNCKELNDILKLYSKMVNVPIKTLLERLDQVSGDFIQLDNFVESKDSKLLWSAEEDEILRKGGVEVELLRKYRGPAVDARRKYLGIS
jgi:hypothetical protein